MTYKVARATHNCRGVDTIIPFSAHMAQTFKEGGYSFVVRYLGALNTTERDNILNAGLGLLAVAYSRRAGWVPSGVEGASDGDSAVRHAQQAGLMRGMTLFCDMEGPELGVSPGAVISYINNWATRVIQAGYLAGLYVGYQVPLTPNQLYHSLNVTGYWSSCSLPQAVAVRGYQMFQDHPGNFTIFGYRVDTNTIKADLNGDTPVWMIAA